jgi:hypothetical protein
VSDIIQEEEIPIEVVDSDEMEDDEDVIEWDIDEFETDTATN